MPARTTRTLNPLHFEDLEPHRFEDLVRQLAYAWREWRQIEATGRLGADEGVDIRGIEAAVVAPTGEEEDLDPSIAEGSDRIWIFQCKRERSIGPTAAVRIVQAALPEGSDAPYGFVLAAACDFSKRSRDAVRAAASARGVKKSISGAKPSWRICCFCLTTTICFLRTSTSRCRSVADVSGPNCARASATKRKLVAVLGGLSKHGEGEGDRAYDVLIRDPIEDGYPWRERVPDFQERPAWAYYWFEGHSVPDHVAFEVCGFDAYIDDDRTRWDWLELPEHLARRRHWVDRREDRDDERELLDRAHHFTQSIPERNRARFMRIGLIHYDDVVAVDEFGDVFNEPPHLLVVRPPGAGFFSWEVEQVSPRHGEWLSPNELTRISYFPQVLPPVPPRAPADEPSE